MNATVVALPVARADRAYGLLTTALVVLGLLFAALPPGLRFISGEVEGPIDDGPLGALQWPLLFLSGAWLLLRRLRLALMFLPWMDRALPLLLLWFLASTLWSAAPAETASRAIRLVALLGCAFAYMLASWERGRLWRHARITLSLLVAGSVLAALLIPEIGTHGAASPEAGKWRGLTTHKNLFGALAALAALFWAHAWLAREVRARSALPWLAVCAVALLGARSTTGLFAGLVAGGVMALWLRPPAALRGRAVPAAAAVVLLGALALHVVLVARGAVTVTDVMQPVAEAAGKDVTLTGRAELWRYLAAEIPHHPWLGVGHGAYWLGEHSLSGHAVRELYWTPNQGHNFYLDLLNEVGIVGVVLFGLFVLSWVRTMLRVRRVDHPLAVLNGALLVFLLVHGISETAMARPITPLTVLMFFALLDMNRRLFEEALRRRASARAAQLAQAVALQPQREPEQHRQQQRQKRRRRKAAD
jgi:exopolysaccharide production protein ExoQ